MNNDFPCHETQMIGKKKKKRLKENVKFQNYKVENDFFESHILVISVSVFQQCV